MGTLGVPELLVILLIALLLFGGKRLPELARSMGEAMHAFKKGLEGGNSTKPPTPPETPSRPPSSPA